MNQYQAQKIIDDTLKVFSQTVAQTEKFKKLPKIDIIDYTQMHQGFLTPLDIKIDCVQFINEIQQYDNEFTQWGTNHTHLPRYGLALVNQSGLLLGSDDPINGSLYQYNEKNPETPIFESDATTKTVVMNLPSLKPLNVFDNMWMRSNVFKWDKSAMFMPHIDAFMPSPWYRLWATLDDNIVVNYFDDGNYHTCTNIEKGRVYLIDTSLVHDANSTDLNYQLFLSVSPAATQTLKNHLLNKL